MLKKVCLGVALLSMSAVASAQIEATAGYSSLDLDEVTLGALVAGVGYRIPLNEAVSLTPGARIGFGIADDSIGNTDYELDSFYGLQMRAQFDTQNGFYLFALPSYSKLEMGVSGGLWGDDSWESDWEFGIGAGAGFKFSDFAGIEASFEKIDEADMLSIQGRFTF